jgi:hypothetical protein
MSGLLILATVLAASPGAEAGTINRLTSAERAAGWKLLFDGSTTGGWHGYRRDAFPAGGWIVEDGCLKVLAGQGGGDIVTNDEFGDFELSLEWKAAPKANSGIIYRVAETQDYPWRTGLEYQILDDAGHGMSPDDAHSAGAMYDLCAPIATKSLRPAGEFNHARVRVKDNVVEHWLNGVRVVRCPITGSEWTARIAGSKFKETPGFGGQPRGRIALQEHGDTVWFRNIKVRNLDQPMPGEVALFDGSSLRGWTHHLEPAGAMSDTWSVSDGILICSGHPAGYIRTEQDFVNYVLKLEWRFNPVTRQAGNSGVLLRLIGPDKVWPRSVEAQLHSENAGDFWNIEDFQMRTDPARTNGRNTKKLAMAENPVGEWNEYEIIVDGPTITLFVNGQKVNEAWDVAAVPGKVALQSEGAEIQFRNVRLAPIQ